MNQNDFDYATLEEPEAEDTLEECHGCGGAFPVDSLHSIDGQRVCGDCLRNIIDQAF
jgi:hypothetical protein